MRYGSGKCFSARAERGLGIAHTYVAHQLTRNKMVNQALFPVGLVLGLICKHEYVMHDRFARGKYIVPHWWKVATFY